MKNFEAVRFPRVRTRADVYELVSQTIWPPVHVELDAGGATPLGYKRDLKGGLLIDEAESAIVRRVVGMRESGLSLQAIATALNETGILTKRGENFDPSTIRYLLDNPKYRGICEYYFRHDEAMHCLTEGSHDAILHNAA